jgi:hypothetical protein
MKTTNNSSEIPINFSNRESLLSANSEIIKQLQSDIQELKEALKSRSRE